MGLLQRLILVVGLGAVVGQASPSTPPSTPPGAPPGAPPSYPPSLPPPSTPPSTPPSVPPGNPPSTPPSNPPAAPPIPPQPPPDPPYLPPSLPPGGPAGGGSREFLRFRDQMGTTWGDPHLNLANGGQADFRGVDKQFFSFLSAPNISVTVMTEDRSFVRWGGQVVHGSFITKLFVKVRSSTTGQILRGSVHADQYNSFRSYAEDAVSTYTNKTRVELPGVDMLQLSGGRSVIHGAGWEVFVNRRRLRKPLSTRSAGVSLKDSESWFLDTSFNILDKDAASAKKFGHSTIGRIAPHGIIGQSFDGSMIAVSGKQDKYNDLPEFTTTAQAEGALEGKHTDYLMTAPFATDFKYSRFDAKSPVAPRDVSKLTGAKAAAKAGAGTSAGSTELFGAE